MITTSYIKYVRISPKKMYSLAAQVVGLHPDRATEQLILFGKKAGKIIAGAIKTALWDATNNLKLAPANLRIKTIEIGKGQVFKRYRAVARGMAHQIKKRTSHIKVTLEEVQSSKFKVQS